MDRITEVVGPRQLAERMRARPGRVRVAADVVGPGSPGRERRRDDPAAGQRHHSAPELAQESPPAGPPRERAPARSTALSSPVAPAPPPSGAAPCPPAPPPARGCSPFPSRARPELVHHQDERRPRTAVEALDLRVVEHHRHHARGNNRGSRFRHHHLADRTRRGREQDEDALAPPGPPTSTRSPPAVVAPGSGGRAARAAGPRSRPRARRAVRV